MTRLSRHRSETIVYSVGWILIAVVMLLDMMRTHAYTSAPLLTPATLVGLLRALAPIFCLFLLHNCVLIPRLLMPGKHRAYLVSTLAAIAIVWLLQSLLHQPPQHLPPRLLHEAHLRPFFTFPRFLDFIFELLTVGINLAIALLFQRYGEQLDAESRSKAAAESRLDYLKAQINPHFYMNMLNNIHGMIDINPAKAQEMVLNMSKLMRYILYDSSLPMVTLANELDFITNYLNVMRMRYPEQKVSISCSLPDPADAAGIEVPPLIFLVYIENAFKHGISYRNHSYVGISLSLDNNRLHFTCINSLSPDTTSHKQGIGLTNARQRLRLIYGTDFELSAIGSAESYTVNLNIPAHEHTHSDNRR